MLVLRVIALLRMSDDLKPIETLLLFPTLAVEIMRILIYSTTSEPISLQEKSACLKDHFSSCTQIDLFIVIHNFNTSSCSPTI